LALLPACGPTAPAGPIPIHPVEGQVLFRGKPVAGALVSLHPADESKFGAVVPRPTGRTDGDGRFRLTTYAGNDGAPAGSYLVSVAGLSQSEGESGSLMDPKRPLTTKDVLGGRYLDPKATGLEVQVKEGPNVLPPFELK
jgi:hypothetical protein